MLTRMNEAIFSAFSKLAQSSTRGMHLHVAKDQDQILGVQPVAAALVANLRLHVKFSSAK